MGRKNNQEDRKSNIKHRKEQKIQKANGTFKKLSTQCNRPPDLSKFKAKTIERLKNKQSGNHQTLAQKLIDQASRKMNIDHFIEEKEEFIQELQVEQFEDGEKDQNNNTQESRRYLKQIKKLIETCDIILEVLDARDPLACRCRQTQKRILAMAGDKKIILVLNKIDLIPLENAYAWQNHLRREYPVVLFKANLQNQNNNLTSFALFKKSIANSTQMAENLIHTTKAIGPDHLLQLIKQLSKIQGMSRAVTVGLIGYPNVGKSSVINSLKRSKTCEVSAIPGCTKNLKEIKLDKEVKLLDCPGVIFEKNLTKNQLILQNTLRADTDLEEVVEAILQRLAMSDVQQVYKIEAYNSVTDFLAKICRVSGKLGKGGIPEMKQGAKLVIQDWNRGKLKYFTIPPSLHASQEKVMDSE